METSLTPFLHRLKKKPPYILPLWAMLFYLLVGVGLFFSPPILPNLFDFQLTIPTADWQIVAGTIVISTTLGTQALSYVNWWLIQWMHFTTDPEASFKSSFILLATEITLYSLSLVAGVKELVAIWLAFKAVSVWPGHTGATDTATRRLQRSLRARQRYNLFLLNNALRLGWGALTYTAILFLVR